MRLCSRTSPPNPKIWQDTRQQNGKETEPRCGHSQHPHFKAASERLGTTGLGTPAPESLDSGAKHGPTPLRSGDPRPRTRLLGLLHRLERGNRGPLRNTARHADSQPTPSFTCRPHCVAQAACLRRGTRRVGCQNMADGMSAGRFGPKNDHLRRSRGPLGGGMRTPAHLGVGVGVGRRRAAPQPQAVHDQSHFPLVSRTPPARRMRRRGPSIQHEPSRSKAGPSPATTDAAVALSQHVALLMPCHGVRHARPPSPSSFRKPCLRTRTARAHPPRAKSWNGPDGCGPVAYTASLDALATRSLRAALQGAWRRPGKDGALEQQRPSRPSAHVTRTRADSKGD